MTRAHRPARAGSPAPDAPAAAPDKARAPRSNADAQAQLSAAKPAFPFQPEMEAAFGMDLSFLTVRFGSAPAAVGAEATAQAGELCFATASPDKETVAHEVAHAVQFLRGPAPQPGTSQPGDAAEQEAERVAAAAAAGRPVSVRQAPTAQTMRKVTYAKQDKYNDSSINNNEEDTGRDQVDRQRPGATLGSGRYRDDTFQINADNTPIYYGNGKLRSTLEDDDEVCINPAEPRKLNGADCVLCWGGDDGPGWVPADAIFDGSRAIGPDLLRKLRGDAYEDWRPAKGNLPYATSRFVFKPAGPAEHDDPAMPSGTGQFVFPNQTEANSTKDHLRRRGTSAGPQDDYYNVFMNLPQRDAAAIAHDVAQPGEYFYVVKVDGRFLKRTVDTFKRGSQKHGKDLTFVYGYVGDETGPNPSRRGWVAYPVLERA